MVVIGGLFGSAAERSHRLPFGCVQKVCTWNVMSLRRPCSCNTIVTNVEVQDTDFLDTPTSLTTNTTKTTQTSYTTNSRYDG